MSLYKRGTVWWIEFVVRGVRVRESTHTSNKDLAIRAERKRRNDIESMANGIRKVRRPSAFVVAAKNWMEENEARWSASYKSIQAYSLKHLRPYFKRMLLQEINASHIGRYQKARKIQGASNRTINMEVSTLRMILKANDLWSHLGDKVRMLPERHSVGKALETEQVHQLLVACRNSPQPSLLTAVVIFANTALQKASGVKARIHDLRHHANTVMVESGTPIPTLKAITGHLTDAMVEHYTHIRDDARRKAVEALEGSGGMAIK